MTVWAILLIYLLFWGILRVRLGEMQHNCLQSVNKLYKPLGLALLNVLLNRFERFWDSSLATFLNVAKRWAGNQVELYEWPPRRSKLTGRPDVQRGAPLFGDAAQSHIFTKARWLNRGCYRLFCCFLGCDENKFTSPWSPHVFTPPPQTRPDARRAGVWASRAPGSRPWQ